MRPPDPTERFKRVTEMDFAANEEEPQCEFKTACALVRFDGVKKRKCAFLSSRCFLCWRTRVFVSDLSGG